jgi:hypothetical protein
LDSNNTDSWTGVLYKANYYIDLTQIIQNNDDFFKSYYMYCSFISTADDVTVNSITPNNVYTLHIDIGKGLNIYQYGSIKTPSFILPVQVNLSDNGAGAPHVGFFLQDKDQMPLYIDNLYNINNIVINVLQNGAFCTATAFYVCILTFVEC